MNFPSVEFLGTSPEFRKKKKKKNVAQAGQPDKTSHEEISRGGRARTAKKCTKKCAARAKWLFSFLIFFQVLVAVAHLAREHTSLHSQ